ncbi:MAG: acetyl-CoA carboxylase biotin carboxyl carrier protein [Verrucomicrobiota bacterium JB022]|nr:acetyl-CoA carboxylase biotin carboxyl carrier protein [Verrucomicrobiota bacterium JB022]
MDIKEIKTIVDLMKRSDLTEFEIEEEGLRLRISRKGTTEYTVAAPLPAAAYAQHMPAPVAAEAPTAPKEEIGRVIKSPMVGTFYGAPSPDSPSFVKAGDTVNPESVVCIIEAMKVMNEIKAELSGTITEILAKNGEPVEYGQPLFRVK